MLAYVFWHRPATGVERSAYERALMRFHQEVGPSASYRVSVPWSGGGTYEDWYLVEDWAALGRLNDDAASGPRQVPHDRVAAASEDGTGAVYRLRHGQPSVDGLEPRAWFAKPSGMSYGELDELIDAVAGPDHRLWQRQLVLGPAPEFCLIAPALDLPSALAASVSRAQQVH